MERVFKKLQKPNLSPKKKKEYLSEIGIPKTKKAVKPHNIIKANKNKGTR